MVEPITLSHSSDLTLEALEEIAWEGRQLALHPELLAHLAATRSAMLGSIGGDTQVYGVTTGMGYLSSVQLGAEEQQTHQANLLLGRAVGGPPFLGRAEARAVLVARLAGFLDGH